MGGKDDDPVARVTGSLSLLDDQLKGIREALGSCGGGNIRRQPSSAAARRAASGARVAGASQARGHAARRGAARARARWPVNNCSLLARTAGAGSSSGSSPANGGQDQRLSRDRRSHRRHAAHDRTRHEPPRARGRVTRQPFQDQLLPPGLERRRLLAGRRCSSPPTKSRPRWAPRSSLRWPSPRAPRAASSVPSNTPKTN